MFDQFERQHVEILTRLDQAVKQLWELQTVKFNKTVRPYKWGVYVNAMKKKAHKKAAGKAEKLRWKGIHAFFRMADLDPDRAERLRGELCQTIHRNG